MNTVTLDRALRLYLQQAPLAELIDELKASASAQGLSLGSLAFQERVAANVIGHKVAEEFPPRRDYTASLTKVFVDASESAGDEPAESLLLARTAYVAGSSQTESLQDETAFESFWLPPGSGLVSVETSFMCGTLTPEDAPLCQEGGREFLSFRVANRNNEVGLRVWEAGRVLAEFCLSRSEWLKGKRVLELGAGIGVTGMVIAGCCNAKEVVLTDYAPRVLANLRFNEEINRSVLGSRANFTSVTVRPLDWTDYADRVPPETLVCHSVRASPAREAPCCHADKVLLQAASAEPGGRPSRTTMIDQPVLSGDDVAAEEPSGWCDCSRRGSSVIACQTGTEATPDTGEDPLGTPEVLLAADVVYDMRFHEALVGVVVETLRRCPDALIIFACTLRDADTIAAFLRCLERAGVPWRDVDVSSAAAHPPRSTSGHTNVSVANRTGSGHVLTSKRAREQGAERARFNGTMTSPLQQDLTDECSREDLAPGLPTCGVEAAKAKPPAVDPRRCSDQLLSSCRLWSHPGEAERVRLYVCGRRAVADDAA